MEKTAVDKKTEAYWKAYFGDYGTLLVRDIERNIRAALSDDLSRTAAAGAPPIEVLTAHITPLGHEVTADRLVLEGRWAADVKQGRRTSKTAKLFRAEFNLDGALMSIDSLAAPIV